MTKGKTEYACSDKISIADFCMMAMSEDIESDVLARESLADKSTGLKDYFLFMRSKINPSIGSIENKSMTIPMISESSIDSLMVK